MFKKISNLKKGMDLAIEKNTEMLYQTGDKKYERNLDKIYEFKEGDEQVECIFVQKNQIKILGNRGTTKITSKENLEKLGVVFDNIIPVIPENGLYIKDL